MNEHDLMAIDEDPTNTEGAFEISQDFFSELNRRDSMRERDMDDFDNEDFQDMIDAME